MKPKFRFSSLSTVIFAGVLAATSANATQYYWDVNGNGAGFSQITGAWNGTNAFWGTDATGTGGTYIGNPTNADDLNIVAATTNSGTITVSGTQNASSISFASGVGAVTLSAGTINIGGTGASSGIFKDSTSAQIVNSALRLNAATSAFALNNSTTGNLTIGGSITGNASSGTQTVTATGRVVLTSSVITDGLLGGKVALVLDLGSGISTALNAGNTFGGGVTLNSGTVSPVSGATYTGFGTGLLTLNGGALRGVNTTAATIIGNDVAWNSIIGIGRAGGGTPIFTFNGSVMLDGAVGSNGSGAEPVSITFNGNVGQATAGSSFSFAPPGSGGVLTFNGTNTYTGNTSTVNKALVIGGSGSMGAGNYAGAITTGSGAIIFSSSANQILSGNIGGGTLTKNTSAISTLTLSGTNTYSGVTTIGAGTLQFAKQTSLYNNVTGNWTAARINVKSAATLAFNVGGTGEFTTSNVTTLLTNLAASSSATNGMNAGSSLGFDTTNASGGTFTIGDVIADTTGTSGGVRGLTKLGTGALVLTSTNTNTGATVVTGGTLLVNGSISTSILTTVESGATIGGSGTVGALTVLAGGNINPGNSPGILNTGTYIQSGLYTAEIAGVTPGTQYDQISVTGTVDITGGSLMTMFSGTGYAAGDLIFILLNDSTDAIAGTYTGFAQGDTVASHDGFNWQIYYDADSVGNTFNNGNDTALFAVVIPEPSTALLGALGALALLRRRR